MTDMEWEDDRVPVFVIDGFIEAGKTKFIQFTMEQEYFKTDGKTVLIVCEVGDEEYDEKKLLEEHTIVIYPEDISEVTDTYISALASTHRPERIIIEWNGMWMRNELKLPDDTFLNQQITIIDTSSLDIFLKNMKPMMGPMLNESEMVICNRADGISEDKLSQYHLMIKAMAPNAEIIFEGSCGEIRGDFSIELPYDIDSMHLDINNDDFGIFYIDAMDRPDRYKDKSVTFTAQVLMPPELGRDRFVAARKAMTCCEADMRYLGFICEYSDRNNLSNGDWVKIKATIKAKDEAAYGRKGAIMDVISIMPTKEITSVVQF